MRTQYLKRIFFLGFLFSFHLALTAYVNSTFLGTLISEKYIGFVYAASSLITLLVLSSLSSLIAKIGNKTATTLFLIGNIGAISAFVFSQNVYILIPAFVLFLITNTLVFYCFDIFIEHWSIQEETGKARGLYLTTINLAWMLSPLITGTLVENYGYKGMYTLAGILGIFVLVLLPFFIRHFKDPKYQKISLGKARERLASNPRIAKIVVINFLLQFFFALMIIYTPLYLHDHLGFDWKHLGIIFTIMLSPFVFLGFPLGKFADKYGYEKQSIIVGFLCIALATGIMAYTHSVTMLFWAMLLLASRVGASIVETMSEIYFFKHVSEKDTDLLSIFRDMSPLAFLIAPLVGSFIITTSTYTVLFGGIALVMLIGAYVTYTLKK